MSAYFESLNRRQRLEPVAQQLAQEPAAEPAARPTPTRLRRLTPGDLPSGYAALAERIMVSANGKPLRTLMFAGCAGGEGSTSVALEFAESLAGAGMNVLLVDADLRTSGLTAGVTPGGADLVEMVSKRQTPPSTQWGRGKLTIVPSPKTPQFDKDRFFRSKEFAAWLEAQQRLHDYLLLDAPPLLHFAEGTLMARLSDGVVIVVRAEVTRRDALLRAREQLTKAGAHVIGVVMNRVKDPVPPFLKQYVSMG
jgi:Mrp family chromosome partitioning ATPase